MSKMPIRAIALFLKPDVPEIVILARDVVAWLRNRAVQVLVTHTVLEQLDSEADGVIAGNDHNLSDVDLAVVLGGDGTILWVARRVAPFDIPVLSFNMGHLGFLAAYPAAEVYSRLEKVLSGDFCTEERMMLAAEHFRGGTRLQSYIALNDVVVNKQLSPRLIQLETCVNDNLINTYLCDGLIISTPTGSTAYSLSAGGPIMLPELKAVVMTPICPHMLTNRPIVMNSNYRISIRLISRDRKAFLTVDGQTGSSMSFEDTVTVFASPYKARIVTNEETPFFEVLRRKLTWGHR
ncbi:NAD(+)/NADH kinase [bacterium]|nr:NAD(+)/NADH kinase [candidate division CSSED10-310 bacterium]